MWLCPFCGRAIETDPTVCPHPDCRKTIAAGQALSSPLPPPPKPPPSRRRVTPTQASAVTDASPASNAPGGRPSPFGKPVLPRPLPPPGSPKSKSTQPTAPNSTPSTSSASHAGTPSPAESTSTPQHRGPSHRDGFGGSSDKPTGAVPADTPLARPRCRGRWIIAATLLAMLALLSVKYKEQIPGLNKIAFFGPAPHRDAGSSSGQGARPQGPMAEMTDARSHVHSDRSQPPTERTPKSALPEEGSPDQKPYLSGAAPADSEGGQIVDGVYALRTRPRTAGWFTARGGSSRSERAVALGLAWLARHQAEDGIWCAKCLAPAGSNEYARCIGTSPCSGSGKTAEMAHTGLAVLAMQGAGHFYFNGQQYSGNVGLGLRWMVENQRDDGALIGSMNQTDVFFPDYMYEHGIATFALAEACALSRVANRGVPPEYHQAAERAVRFIEQNQHSDGGWRYTPNRAEPSDSSVSIWQVLALWSAQKAGIKATPDCLAAVQEFYSGCEIESEGRTRYMANRGVGTEATTGAGMLVHQFLSNQPEPPLLTLASARLVRFAADNWTRQDRGKDYNDFYLWYLCTWAMSQADSPAWEQWNRSVQDTVVTLQRHVGCEAGSWPPEGSAYGRGRSGAGRIYTTALAVMTLEVYYRFTAK